MHVFTSDLIDCEQCAQLNLPKITNLCHFAIFAHFSLFRPLFKDFWIAYVFLGGSDVKKLLKDLYVLKFQMKNASKTIGTVHYSF